MSKSVGVQKRRETVLPDNAVYAALGAMAAVIEEPCCLVGAEELRGLVASHGRLSEAAGFRREYRYHDGVAFNQHGGVVKDVRPGQAMAAADHSAQGPLDLAQAHDYRAEG